MEAAIYIGTPEALQAEIGLLDCYKGAFVVAAFRANGEEVTPEIAADKEEADGFRQELTAWLEGEGETVRVSWVS